MADPPSNRIGPVKPVRVPSHRPGPIGGKREQNRARRTRDLCDAALGLFLERGLESVTIEEITQKTGISKGSFYRYFEGKDQLVEALFEPLALAIRDALLRADQAVVKASNREELLVAYGRLGEEVISLLLPEPRLLRLYLQECRGPAEGARAPVRRIADLLAAESLALTRTAERHGLLAPLPPDVIAAAVVGAVESLLFHYVEGRDLGDPRAATDALVRMILDGIVAKPSRAPSPPETA